MRTGGLKSGSRRMTLCGRQSCRSSSRPARRSVSRSCCGKNSSNVAGGTNSKNIVKVRARSSCFCAEVIRSKGLEKITVDELVAEITPRGRGAFLVCCATRDARPRSDGARRGQNGTSTEHPKIPPGASTDVRLRYLRCHRPRRQGAFCQSILQRARPGEPRRF